MAGKFKEEDLGKIRPVSIEDRESKVRADDFVDPESAGGGALIDRFPGILKGGELEALVGALKRARDERRDIVWMIGAHVIKTGLSVGATQFMGSRQGLRSRKRSRSSTRSTGTSGSSSDINRSTTTVASSQRPASA